MRATLPCVVAIACLAILPAAKAADTGVNWAQVLGPAQGTVPPPMDAPAGAAEVKGGPKAQMVTTAINWRPDLRAAMAEAQQTGRPIFVTLRCLPCKQCADFDKDVLEGGPELSPLLRQFITVRLTDTANVDMRLLPMARFQDMDLSWWGYFLSPDGRLYGVFGGKDHVSEATRISEQALVNNMKRVLAHHYDPRRASWNLDGAAPDLAGAAPTPTRLPGYASWEKGLFPGAPRDCLHCHQVVEVMRQPAIDAKTFDKQRDTQVWPLPENVGITVDRDSGLLVNEVAPGSAADKAGIKAGDVLGAANGRLVFGQADFRGVLHRGPQGAGSIDVVWLRGSDVMTGKLDVEDGWRKTSIGWRMSISGGNFGASPGFFPLKGPARADGLSIKPYWGPKSTPAPARAGLTKGQVVIAVNGQSPALDGRDFVTWYRLKFEPGDTITLTVQEPGGQKKDITYQATGRDW